MWSPFKEAAIKTMANTMAGKINSYLIIRYRKLNLILNELVAWKSF